MLLPEGFSGNVVFGIRIHRDFSRSGFLGVESRGSRVEGRGSRQQCLNTKCLGFFSRKSDLTCWWQLKQSTGERQISERLYLMTFWVVATQTFFEFSPRNLGKIPILTNIFFRWVRSTTNQLNLIFCKMKDVWMVRTAGP